MYLLPSPLTRADEPRTGREGTARAHLCCCRGNADGGRSRRWKRPTLRRAGRKGGGEDGGIGEGRRYTEHGAHAPKVEALYSREFELLNNG